MAVENNPMTVHHQLSAVPHGSNIVITLDNETTFTEPVGTCNRAQKQEKNRVQPLDTVFGNCGYSYTYLYDWGSLKGRLAVGFHVGSPAVNDVWDAHVNGAGSRYYEYHHEPSGDLAWREDWAGAPHRHSPRSGVLRR